MEPTSSFPFSEFFIKPYSVSLPREYVNFGLSEDDNLLTFCARTQNRDAFKVLLELGADPNLQTRKGLTPLTIAVHRSSVEFVELLLNCPNIDVNAQNSTGSTPLIQACHFGNFRAARLLLEHQALPDFTNLNGTTALMRASQEGHVEICKLLISYKVDVNKKNLEGMSALMLAAQRGHEDVLTLLIRHNAAIDDQTYQGSTALMLACKRGHVKCVEVLVAVGCEIYSQDLRGRTAHEIAQHRNDSTLLHWLDTQVQVGLIQDSKRRYRTALLHKYHQAFWEGRLVMNEQDKQTLSLLESIKTNNISPEVIDYLEYAKISNAVKDRRSEATAQLKEYSCKVLNEYKKSSFGKEMNLMLSERKPSHRPWEWPQTLLKAFALPKELFDKVVDFLPMPRIWSWSLSKLQNRCKLAPLYAIKDLCIIMDDILTDSNIFSGSSQFGHLVRIGRLPEIHHLLRMEWGMSSGLISALVTWGDTQSIASRCTTVDIFFRPKFAREMLAVAIELFRWYISNNNCTRTLKMVHEGVYIPGICSTNLSRQVLLHTASNLVDQGEEIPVGMDVDIENNSANPRSDDEMVEDNSD